MCVNYNINKIMIEEKYIVKCDVCGNYIRTFNYKPTVKDCNNNGIITIGKRSIHVCSKECYNKFDKSKLERKKIK